MFAPCIGCTAAEAEEALATALAHTIVSEATAHPPILGDPWQRVHMPIAWLADLLWMVVVLCVCWPLHRSECFIFTHPLAFICRKLRCAQLHEQRPWRRRDRIFAVRCIREALSQEPVNSTKRRRIWCTLRWQMSKTSGIHWRDPVGIGGKEACALPNAVHVLKGRCFVMSSSGCRVGNRWQVAVLLGNGKE